MAVYETLNEALVGCVKAAGGSKVVGPALWPTLAPEVAQRRLLDCLNEDRTAKLSPDEAHTIFRLARARGHHDGIAFVLSDLGYNPTTPTTAQDVVVDLQRQVIDAVGHVEKLVKRMEDVASRMRGQS
jgi:hypothetical protein